MILRCGKRCSRTEKEKEICGKKSEYRPRPPGNPTDEVATGGYRPAHFAHRRSGFRKPCFTQLKIFWVGEQCHHSLNQPTGGASIHNPVVERNCEFRHQDRFKLALRFIPYRTFFTTAQPDNQRFSWQRNGSSPGDSEGAKIRDRSDRAFPRLLRQTSRPSSAHQILI